jgi:hypothetical protein
MNIDLNLNINKLLYLYLMITCNLVGGLGNQLFQIFTTISYAVKSKEKFVFLNSESVGTGITKVRNTYWNNLLCKLKPFLSNNFSNYNVIREKEFIFNDIISEINTNKISNINTCLYGYFQSYKYFQNNHELICRLLDIQKQKETVSKSYRNFKLQNTVSMHFRLGDYKLLSKIYPILSYEYYEKAFEYIQKHNLYHLNILFFCEDEDLDEVNIIIEKLKKKFCHNGISRAPSSLKDWEQMLLMSCCNYNIIANSSFSWWGAYLNSNSDKIVCYPEVWFVNNIDTSDLCPLEWIKI